ncbi:cytochrome b [Sphingomonas sinipercae]|uniref:Cytochrome b n=1 Tax=Sphingomonas sinipercae TaxID=2714944 RepID=A0A6G7ZQ18_9SPHN|nr:cytochrome b/b6 domain-containing protein [Sphingomonas sinipercae]QIL03019.1 cytochrome b [Sphingomonas sinipercae]
MDRMTDTAPHAVPVRRYSNVAVAFHWVTVVLVLLQIWLGFSFGAAEGAARGNLFTWHKTTGAVILLLTLARLTYRISNPPPPLPDDLSRWERFAAVWNHRLFYILLLALPVGGLIAVSARATGPTTPLIGGVPLPVLPGVPKSIGELAGEAHELAAFALIALIVIHFLAAMKHQFIDKAASAGRMPPFQPPHHEPVVIGQGGQTEWEER